MQVTPLSTPVTFLLSPTTVKLSAHPNPPPTPEVPKTHIYTYLLYLTFYKASYEAYLNK